MPERRQPLTDEEVNRIASAVAQRASEAFHISEEKHYNDHQRLSKLLDAYESAQSTFWKAFLALVIAGSLIMAAVAVAKGAK